MWNDLAVAYIERARSLARFQDWPRALAASERAYHLNPALLAAQFNRALAAQSLGLSDASIKFWESYVAEDRGRGWRDEARTRLAEVKAASTPAPNTTTLQTRVDRGDFAAVATLASTFPHRVREFAEDHLLPLWAAATIERRPGSAIRYLEAAHAISRAPGQPDGALAQVVDQIALLEPGATRDRLARGYVAFGTARRQYDANAFADASATFATMIPLFGHSTHPFALWGRLHVAIGAYYRGEYAAVRVEAAAIEKAAAAQGYVVIAARAAWMRGLAANLQSDFRDALHHLNRSAEGFERTGDAQSLAAVRIILANVYLYVGSKGDVWRNTVTALIGSRSDPSPRRRHTQLLTASHQALVGDMPEAALVLQSEALRIDTAWGDPAALSEVYNYRSRSLAALQRTEEAEAEIVQARSHVQRVADTRLRNRLEAEIFQTEVDVLVQSDPKRGREAADRAIAHFADANAVLRLPRLYLARGRAWQTLGAHDRAAADFAAAADRFESERSRLPRSQALRLSHVDELWRVYPRLIEASQQLGASCSELLATAERGRAFNLREARGQLAASPSVLPTLGADEIIVYYTSLPARLLILTLYQGGCDVTTSPVTSKQLEQLTSRWMHELLANEDLRVGRDLFDAIIRPVWPRIRTAKRLGIVADGPLHSLPFAALPTGDSRRLIHHVDLRLLPTLAFRARGIQPAGELPRVSASAVVATGGVAGDETLPVLPFAQTEAATVSRLLVDHGLSIKSQTDAPLLAQLGSATIFHFAGHAIANPTFPLMSRLVVARPREPWLTAEAIGEARFRTLQLVVLSACDTDRGQVYGGDGPATLARAFLSAGAPQVVATLWPVQDRATLHLINSFYEQWLRSGDAPAALRQAMLDGMARNNLDWAAWVAVTSY